METTKIERGVDGRAVAVSITVRVGREMLTFREDVERRDVEALARLRAEAAVMKRALDAQASYEAELRRPGFPTLVQWFEHWVHYRYDVGLWGRGASQKGRESQIRTLWRYIDPRWHRMPVDSFTPALVKKLIGEVADTHAPSTVCTFIDMLKPLFEDAVRYGWEDGSGNDVPWRARLDPTIFVRKPHVDSRARRTLTADELCALLEVSEKRHGGIHWTTRCIAFGAVLGLRVGEIVGLRWEQITLTPGAEQAGVITWKCNERKGGIGLRVPIPRVLLKYLPPFKTSGRVFTPLCDCRARKLVNAELRAAAVDAGFDPDALTSHCLRHSFAHSVYRRAGAVTADVTRALGHTSEATTRRYLRAVDDLDRLSDTIAPHADAVVPQ